MLSISENVHKLKAISDETRLRIVQMLSIENLCACHILEEFNISQPTLSYHMKILVDSEFVISEKAGNWIRYSLNKKIFDDFNDFFATLNSQTSKAIDREVC